MGRKNKPKSFIGTSGSDSWGNDAAKGAVGGGSWGYYLAILFLPLDSLSAYMAQMIFFFDYSLSGFIFSITYFL